MARKTPRARSALSALPLLATLLLLPGLIAPANAAAADSCSYNGADTATISTDGFFGAVDVLSRNGAAITFNGSLCPGPMFSFAAVTNTELITITNNTAGDQRFRIDLSNGPFIAAGTECLVMVGANEIEIEVDLGTHNGGDTLEILGTAAADHYRFGAQGVQLNVEPNVVGCDDVDIRGPGNTSLTTVETFEVTPGLGTDTISGALGTQTGPLASRLLVDESDGANDTFTGGAATNDALNYGFVPAPDGVTVDLRITAPQDTGVGTDQLSAFEDVSGSISDDVLIGDSAANRINASSGMDRVAGLGGDDDLDGGGVEPDTVDYSEAAAPVSVDLRDQGFTQDTMGAGMDDLDDFENLIGSAFGDNLNGDVNPNVITGGDGIDDINARDGADTLLIRDGLGDTARCGLGADNVTADVPGLDIFPSVPADCEMIDFLPLPTPTPTVPLIPAAGSATATKNCKKGRKLNKKTGKCVKKRKKKRR